MARSELATRRRRRRTRFGSKWQRGLLVLLLVLAVWGMLPNSGTTPRREEGIWARSGYTIVARNISVPSPRLKYPFSVIPGGVASAAELLEIMRRDGVVAAHYQALRLKYLKLLWNESTRLVYVSYRQGQDVYWTRKKVRLQAGELLLGDGQITVRARCGNQISEIAREPVSENEPEEAEMNRPVGWEGTGWVEPETSLVPDYLLQPIFNEEFLPAPVFHTDFGTILPFVPNPFGYADEPRKVPTPDSNSPADTPEPASIYLALAGLFLMVAFGLRRSYVDSLRDLSQRSVAERRCGENCSTAPLR